MEPTPETERRPGRERLHEIIFEADTPLGKVFDLALLSAIVLSIAAVIEDLQNRARRNTPTEIRIATAYYKPDNNRTDRVPDYFVHRTDDWLVFPHELNGLSREEILNKKPGVAAVIAKLESSD